MVTTLIPLDTVVTVRETTAPLQIGHHNLFRATELTGQTGAGYSSGQSIAAMEEVAKKVLPPGMNIEWSGLTWEEIRAGQQSLLIFAVGLVFVFLVLAAQYESFALPIIILFAVPVAILGGLLLQWVRGLANDVFCQIGLVMLVGLASKNAILIIEFAEQLRARGKSLVEAAVEASQIRLRPILMTSLAFILGLLPLVVARGAGQESRHSLGTPVLGGMIVSTGLNLFFIPVLYVAAQGLLAKYRKVRQPDAEDGDDGIDGLKEGEGTGAAGEISLGGGHA
jgi:HAE1 family hydrophobic/amphiphilic exporter-1